MDHMGFQIPGMAPSIVHQPPRIFGGYGPDGMQVPQLHPDLAAHMFTDSAMLLDDSNDPKRRRIARVRRPRHMFRLFRPAAGVLMFSPDFCFVLGL